MNINDLKRATVVQPLILLDLGIAQPSRNHPETDHPATMRNRRATVMKPSATTTHLYPFLGGATTSGHPYRGCPRVLPWCRSGWGEVEDLEKDISGRLWFSTQVNPFFHQQLLGE
jgi:hypothetical protein